MNRFLRKLFFCLGVALIIYAVLLGAALHVQEQSVWRFKLFWACLAGVLFFFIAAWRFPLKSNFGIFILLLSLFGLEIILQALGWAGILPGVSTKLKVSYARVYWTSEGRGNSIRNRFGWHYPEFELSNSRRIAVIGDSFVEAVEVGRGHNEAAVLHQLLQKDSPRQSVLAFGTHGTSPAHYIEVIQYAWRYFRPEEVVLLIYLGNDVTETSPQLNYVRPEQFIYHDLDTEGRLVLLPASTAAQARFNRALEQCHLPVWRQLPLILNSHCMLLQSLTSVRDTAQRWRRQATLKAGGIARLGVNLEPFAVPASEEVTRAMRVLLRELEVCKEICATNQMQLRLVTVPFFPPEFYATQAERNWTAKIGRYDYLQPDREIAAFASAQSIPFLSLADHFVAKQLDVKEIQSLYLSNGSGHFTEKGHRFCAEAMRATFYTKEVR